MRKDEQKAKDMAIFLGFSPSGVVEGEVVYANFGTEENFSKLKAMDVSVKDKIVLVRGGEIFRGNKVWTIYTTKVVEKLALTPVIRVLQCQSNMF